jgi:hypothetical protein
MRKFLDTAAAACHMLDEGIPDAGVLVNGPSSSNASNPDVDDVISYLVQREVGKEGGCREPCEIVILPPGGDPQDSNNLRVMLVDTATRLGLIDDCSNLLHGKEPLVVACDQAIYKRICDLQLPFVIPTMGQWHVNFEMVRLIVQKYSSFGILEIATEFGVALLQKFESAAEYRPTLRCLQLIWGSIGLCFHMAFTSSDSNSSSSSSFQDMAALEKVVLSSGGMVAHILLHLWRDITYALAHRAGIRRGNLELQVRALQAFAYNFPLLGCQNYSLSSLHWLASVLHDDNSLLAMLSSFPSLGLVSDHFALDKLRGADELLEEYIKKIKQAFLGYDVSFEAIRQQVTYHDIMKENVDVLKALAMQDLTSSRTKGARAARSLKMQTVARWLLPAILPAGPGAEHQLCALPNVMNKQQVAKLLNGFSYGRAIQEQRYQTEVTQVAPKNTKGFKTKIIPVAPKQKQKSAPKAPSTAQHVLAQGLARLHERARLMMGRGEVEQAQNLLNLGTSQLAQYNLTISDLAGNPRMANKSSLVPQFIEKHVAGITTQQQQQQRGEQQGQGQHGHENDVEQAGEQQQGQGQQHAGGGRQQHNEIFFDRSSIRGELAVYCIDFAQLLTKRASTSPYPSFKEFVDTILYGPWRVGARGQDRGSGGILEHFKYSKKVLVVADDNTYTPPFKEFARAKRTASYSQAAKEERICPDQPIDVQAYLQNRNMRPRLLQAIAEALLAAPVPAGKELLLDFKSALLLPREKARRDLLSLGLPLWAGRRQGRSNRVRRLGQWQQQGAERPRQQQQQNQEQQQQQQLRRQHQQERQQEAAGEPGGSGSEGGASRAAARGGGG